MKKNIMHPAVLFSLVWLVVLIAHFSLSYTLLYDLFSINISTYFIILFGAFFFSFGSLLATSIWEKKEIIKNINNVHNISEMKISLTLRYIFLSILVIGLPFYIIASYRLFLLSNIDDFFIGLRTELVYGEVDVGLTKYLISFSFIVFAINLYSFFKEKNKTNIVLLVISLLISSIYVLLITGRGLFFIILSLYIGMAYLHNKSFSIKKIFRFLALFIALFMIMGIIYGKGGSKEDSLLDNVKPATQTVAIYFVSALNALDWEMHHQFKINYRGDNSLRLFIKIGKQLNLFPNTKINELVQPFVFVPYPTNVYTLYSPYIKDFGKLYTFFIITIFGFIHTWLHDKAVSTKKFRYSLYYSFLLFPLLISFFMDFYLTILSTWIQVIFFTEFFIYCNEIFNVKRVRTIK